MEITTNRLVELVREAKGIVSLMWQRRCDSYKICCVDCECEVASHEGKKICNVCGGEVLTRRIKKASKGDWVCMQLVAKLPGSSTMKSKNFTGVGGKIFNREDGEEIVRKKNLLKCWKFGEQIPVEDADELRRLVSCGDLQATARTVPMNDVKWAKIAGVEYEVAEIEAVAV